MTTDTTMTRASLTLDLTGGQISTGGRGPIPPGYYPVAVREAGLYQTTNGQSVKFIAEVTDGEHAGSTAWIFIGIDMTKEANKNIWQTALVSMGYDAAAVNSVLTIDTDMFIDRPAFIKVSPQKADPEKMNRAFITREEYDRAVTKAAPVGMTVQTVPQQRVASVTGFAGAAPAISAPSIVPQPAQQSKLGAFLKR